MNVRENDRVQGVGDIFDGKVGTVKSVYDSLGMAVVKFDEGVAKVPLSCLVKIKSQENAEPKTEIPEGAKKISRADYDAALIEVATKSLGKTCNIKGVMTGAIIGEFIGSEIFKESDVVVVTEDQFIAVLWAGCSPEAVNETVGNEMPIGKALDVGIAALMSLRALPEILFEADNG